MKQEIGQQKTVDVLETKMFYITRKTKRKLISKFAAIGQKHFSCNAETVQFELLYTVEPRFNEMPRDWQNWFVISRVRYIENLDLTNLRKNNQIVRHVDGWIIFFYFFNRYNFLWCDVTLLSIIVIIFRRYCIKIRFSCTTELS